MNGIIYTRVSSDEQVKGTSLDSQEKACRNYCKNKGIKVSEVFREEGVSAKTAERKELLRAINYCQKNKGKVDAFVVHKVDRFARNTEDHFYVRKKLADYGVTLHSVSETIGNNPVEKLMETMLAGVAEFDNAIRRQRCSDGMSARFNQGIYPLRQPLGYKCSHFRQRGMKKDKPDPPDEQIFSIIQKGLREYATGNYSKTGLAELLDNLGLKKIRGRKTTKQLACRILYQYLPFYAGIIKNPWTNEEIQGLHEPMITMEEYYQINQVKAGRKNHAKKCTHNPDFPLRGIVLCADCEKPLTAAFSSGRGRKYAYYSCFNPECAKHNKTIRKADIENDFRDYLKKIKPNEKFQALFRETVIDFWKDKSKDYETEVLKWNRQIENLEAKKKILFEMREDGSYSKEEFLERKAQVENEIMTATISRNENKIDQFDIEASITYATNFLCRLDRLWFDLPAHLIPRFKKLVFPSKITYQKGRVFETAELGAVFTIMRQIGTKKSRLVDLPVLKWNTLENAIVKWLDVFKSYGLANANALCL
jgi:site-specific DNA recombinase